MSRPTVLLDPDARPRRDLPRTLPRFLKPVSPDHINDDALQSYRFDVGAEGLTDNTPTGDDSIPNKFLKVRGAPPKYHRHHLSLTQAVGSGLEIPDFDDSVPHGVRVLFRNPAPGISGIFDLLGNWTGTNADGGWNVSLTLGSWRVHLITGTGTTAVTASITAPAAWVPGAINGFYIGFDSSSCVFYPYLSSGFQMTSATRFPSSSSSGGPRNICLGAPDYPTLLRTGPFDLMSVESIHVLHADKAAADAALANMAANALGRGWPVT